MPWYAVEALDDALDATKALLLPIDARQWFKLALVVFFLGSVGSGGPSVSAGGSTGGPTVAPNDGLPTEGPIVPPGDAAFPFTFEQVFPFVLAVVTVGFLVGLLYLLLGSIMEFVFVESLRRQRVRIRGYADQHFGRALGVFAFRIALGLVVFVPTAVVVLTAISFAGGQPQVSVGVVLIAVPLLVLLGIAAAVADTFTSNFVVPVMIQSNVGVLDGWRRFWPTLTDQWKQYAVYALVWLVLAFAVGVLASIIGSVVGAVLAAPVAIAGFLAIPALGGPAAILANPVALAIAVAIVLGYVVVLTAALAVVLVPIQTYLGYHALLVLGDSNADFDLIPDLRRAIREVRE